MNDVTPYRIGLGHDSHRLADGGPLRLGGVEIPYHRRLMGHSDADVVLHALTDALLGGIAAGDIGDMFPDDDERNRGRDSAEFVLAAMERVKTAGYRVGNVDCTVFAQEPKLGPFKNAMAARIAQLMKIDVSCVNVKAKTGEGAGPVGQGDVMEAHCAVLLLRDPL